MRRLIGSNQTRNTVRHSGKPIIATNSFLFYYSFQIFIIQYNSDIALGKTKIFFFSRTVKLEVIEKFNLMKIYQF